MVERSIGRAKLTPEVRQRLADMAAEVRQLVYGEAGCPEWGTLFAEIEDDAREVGLEFIRLLMQQATQEQAETLQTEALNTGSGEVAQSIGSEERTIETESGEVKWDEPKAYLPKSRKAFFPQSKALGLGVDEDLSPGVMRNTHPRNCLRVGYFISPCAYKTTTDYVAQFFIGLCISACIWQQNFPRFCPPRKASPRPSKSN